MFLLKKLNFLCYLLNHTLKIILQMDEILYHKYLWYDLINKIHLFVFINYYCIKEVNKSLISVIIILNYKNLKF